MKKRRCEKAVWLLALRADIMRQAGLESHRASRAKSLESLFGPLLLILILTGDYR